MSRIEELDRILREAADAYYNSGTPLMSDAEFDVLRDELQGLDPKHPFLSEVGAPPSDTNILTTAPLSIPMGSLEKVNNPDEFATFLKSISHVTGDNPTMAVQCKYDGSSIEIEYRNGKLHRAVTRGDGFKGDDVTHSIKHANGLPKTVTGLNNFFVRCEAILPVEDWKKHFEVEGDKNPRNSSTGTVRNTETDKAVFLHCLAFNIHSSERTWTTRQSKMNWLLTNGFEVAKTTVVPASEVAKVVDEQLQGRAEFAYEIDGMVVHLNDEPQYERLGDSSNRPKAARAWKFPPMGAPSTIEAVTWDVGTRGTITPVAVVKPVKVGGVTITNITLHNMSEIDRKGICIGDEVMVFRRGDVIPYIENVIKPGANRVKIERNDCPGCGGKVSIDGPFLRCDNPKNCPGTQAKRIKGWISKREIKYLGDSTLEKLLAAKTVRRVPDIYMLTVPSMVAAGIGEGTAKRILPEIEKSLDVYFCNLVGSLSIDLLGRRQALKIVQAGVISLEQWEQLTEAQLVQFEGYGQVKAGRIIAELREAWPLVKELAGMLKVKYEDPRPKKKVDPATGAASGRLKGASFCFTGKMEKQRKELQSLVDQNGGLNFDDVNGSLTYLVIDDVNSTTSKAKKARKLGTTLLSESQFMAMVS